jgi:hypothetical protein
LTVAKDLAPRGEWLVAGDDQARAFVAAGDEHEHQVRCLGVERDVADLVTDEQWVALETAQLVLEAALALCVGEQSDPLGGGAEQDTLPGEACADRERDREMCLAGAGWPKEDDVFLGVQEVELPEMLDYLLFDGALEGEVELLERLSGWEPCGFDPQLAAGGVPGGDLRGQQRFGEPLVAPFLRACTLAQLRHRACGRGGLHRPEQVRELGRAAHAISRS